MSEPTPGVQERPTPNPLEAKLANQGIPLKVPDRFKVVPSELSQLARDEKTELYINDDHIARQYLAGRLTDSIRKGKPWALISSDADNLKKGNSDHGRAFGDMVIRYGAAAITQALQSVELSEHAEIIAMREATAGDETTIWCFNITDEDIVKLESVLPGAGTPHETQDPKFSFSISAGIISSQTPQNEEALRETQQWVTENPSRIAFAFYQGATEKVDYMIKLEKLAKDMERLPLDEILTLKGMNNFVELIKNNLGDSRISKNLLDILLRLGSIQAIVSLKERVSNEAAYTVMLAELGVDENRLREANTIEARVAIFRDLFGTA